MMLQLDYFADFIRALFSPLVDFITSVVPGNLLEGWLMSAPVIILILFALIALIVGLRYNPLPVSFLGLILSMLSMVIFDPATYFGGQSFGGLFVMPSATSSCTLFSL